VITIQNLSFSYGKDEVLKDINLTIYPRDFLTIIGPNGGGKSTLLKLILGLLKPKSGKVVKIGGLKIGYVPQNTNINIDFPIRVFEVVLMGQRKKGFLNFLYTKEEKELAKELLQKVEMQEFFSSKIKNLSGGQRQRVMIAKALSNNPHVLILDEPTASIDVQGQKQIYELLKELSKDTSIVVVSHDLNVILNYTKKVAYVNKTLTYHDSINFNKNIDTNHQHFCEVELLQALGECRCGII